MSVSERHAAIVVEVNVNTLAQIDALKAKWCLRSRGSVVNRLLEEIFARDDGIDNDAYF